EPPTQSREIPWRLRPCCSGSLRPWMAARNRHGFLIESVPGPGLAFSPVTTAVQPPLCALGLWERFQAGNCPADQVARNPLLQRWQRCRDAGLSAENPGDPVMASEKLAESRERFAPVLAPGAPFD